MRVWTHLYVICALKISYIIIIIIIIINQSCLRSTGKLACELLLVKLNRRQSAMEPWGHGRLIPTIVDGPRLSPTAPDYRRRSPTIANKRNEAQTVAAVPIANFLRLSCNIGDFLVAVCLCFETSPGADPFTWKLVLFTCKWTNIFMWIKRVSIRKTLYWDSLWNRGEISCYNFRKTGFRCKRDVTCTRLFRLSDRRRTCCLWTRPK